jgi:hypothetical protein
MEMVKASRPQGKGSQSVKSPSSLSLEIDSRQAREGSDQAGNRGSWIREDGAICFDNECITLKPKQDGQLELTYDPDKCSCDESNSAILDALAECVISGKGINLVVKPKAESK